jgi:hypothetical protein
MADRDGRGGRGELGRERRAQREQLEHQRAMDWRARYGNQHGFGASSGYGGYSGSFGMGGYGGYGGYGVPGGFGGDHRAVTVARADWDELDHARGPHYGKGPKGYRRSDERILEDLADRISAEDEIDASDVEVSVEGGVVTLSGTVERRGDRRILELLVEDVLGVVEVRNEMHARRDPRFTHLAGRGPNAPSQRSERAHDQDRRTR